ncbi:TPA: methylated-DNA--[protein]-cysteine S-methyltransferase [Photobacterium damselae]
MQRYYTQLDTELGTLTLCASDNGLTHLWIEGQEIQAKDKGTRIETHPILVQACQEITDYLAGTTTTFSTPLDLSGTPFQQSVWQQLLTIPYGKTCCYQDIAKALGKPKACQAVGMANRHNPVAIIVPCHRVIGKNGSMTGYDGGISIKERLLDLERAL